MRGEGEVGLDAGVKLRDRLLAGLDVLSEELHLLCEGVPTRNLLSGGSGFG
jgi:hypothetical protein